MPDFLNTSDVPIAPFGSTTQSQLPDWYTNYAMQVLSNQQAVSGTPYQPYTAGPRVADFTPDQQSSFDATRSAAGSFQPALDAARGVLNTTAGGPAPSALAQPYLAKAGQSSYSTVGNYMDPYQSAVVDRIGVLGNRNLQENILPSISDTFVAAGGYGGSRQAEAIGRAIRDTQEGISAAQGQALSQGYQGALGAANTDLSRQGALASTAGNLGVADVNAGLATAGALQTQGAQTQALGLQGAGALSAIGGQQQALDQKNLDTGYADFLRQQGWDQSQIDALTKTLNGVAPAVPKGQTQVGYQGIGSPTDHASTTQAILSALGAVLGLG